ncbi:MAG: carbon-nitrogen hydrolase family protein [Anaerolineales bacterium]|nr:carbon-nitrogen hydrolase family protein [Anaerolineales bacterium]MCB9144870.1 carbon-nitrogen hydrolase family protein [Anaerolineales bacterium]
MNNKSLRYIYLTIAAILGLFIGGKWNIPLAAWIAPLFVLRFFRESDKAGRNFLLLWVVSAIPTIISWQGATFMSKIHPLAEVGFFLLTTPLGLLPYAIDRLYYRRFGSTAWLTLVFPIANSAMDFFSASGSPFGTFGAMAYSQRDFLPAMQIVSVTGLWGVTFVMSWFASLTNHFWDKKPAPLSWTFAGLLALILSLSLGRTLLPVQPEQTAQIAGFSLPAGKLTEVMNQFSTGNEAVLSDLHTDELNQIRTLAGEGANIVVLQEGAGIGTSEQVAKLIADASAIAKEKNIYIVLPVFDLGKQPAENKVHIIDPNGEIVLTHVKYGGNDFEGSLRGDGVLQTVDTPYGKLSAVICWDADFPTVIKQAGKQDVDLLFIPSNDWREVKDIHAGMATFRAVENGMSIFRQTGEGVSVVTNAYGKVINRVDMFEENASGFTGIQNVQTPIGSVNTLYPSVGDGVGNVMLLGLAGLLIGLFVTRKKKISLA